MVGGFSRTLSFPTPKHSSYRSAAKRSAYKIRSASLPVRFHPLVTNLDDYVASLRSWGSNSGQSPCATWLSDGATLISLVLNSLSDLLSHPQSADPLRNSVITDPFLDDLMRLADIQESFRISLINLLHVQAETRAAIRRRDPTRLASAIRAQTQACREISRLASLARNSARTRPLLPPSPEFSVSPDKSGVATIPVAICDAAIALGETLSEVMFAVVRLSEEATRPIAPVMDTENPVKVMRIWWVADLIRWKGRARRRALEKGKNGVMEGRIAREEMERKVALERFDTLETCIRALEISSERIFRALVNGRVLLLNILTPSI